MGWKEIALKIRENKKTKAWDVNIPKKKLPISELDKIQKTGTIKYLYEDEDG